MLGNIWENKDGNDSKLKMLTPESDEVEIYSNLVQRQLISEPMEWLCIKVEIACSPLIVCNNKVILRQHAIGEQEWIKNPLKLDLKKIIEKVG